MTDRAAADGERSAHLVEARELAYVYPDGSPALRGVSLGVRPGETLGLLGPNGSGKTTLLRLLALGDGVILSGQAADPGGRWLALDEPVFRDWLGGRENAVALLELRGRSAGASGAAADEWLSRFGLEEHADRSVGSYSRGMRRRLGLAVAFAAAPALALLDEPLAALDPEGRRVLAAALARHRPRGGSVVLSTHEPEFARAHCDRVAFLLDGRCAAVDTPSRLLAGLGAEPRIEVRFAEGGAPRTEALAGPPEGVRPVERGDDVFILAVADPRAALPAALAWLLSADADVVSVDVREPTLEDAFFAVTGRRLDDEAR